ncbi:mandelate racemase/muconate lactonizing enzyme family protein [Natrialbaceae archaeon A-CW1-1]
MAIEKCETFTADNVSIVRVTTSNGDSGFGQMAPPGTHDHPGLNEITVATFHRLIAPRALGEAADDIGHLIDEIMRATYKYPGTFALRALCGLDTALWDLKGRREGASVCELLGGPSNPDPVAAYGSRPSRETTPEEEVEICTTYADKLGLEAFKLKIGKRLSYDELSDPSKRTEPVVHEFRNVFGTDRELMVDANGAYSPKDAIEVGKKVLEPNDVILFEEPCPYWEFEWMKEVTESLEVTVSGGEQNNLLGQWGKQWERIIGNRIIDVVQPDIGYVGGIERTKRIANLASEAGLSIVPHAPTHSMQKVFTLHLIAAVDNAGLYPFEYQIPVSSYEGLYDPEPHVVDGEIAVPSGSGWGVEVNESWLERAQYAISEI